MYKNPEMWGLVLLNRVHKVYLLELVVVPDDYGLLLVARLPLAEPLDGEFVIPHFLRVD